MILSRSLVFLAAITSCIASPVVAATTSPAVCTTQPKASTKPRLHCGQQGTLTRPALIDDVSVPSFDACRDSCRPYNVVPCVSFAYNAATASCKRFSTKLAKQGFTKASPDGYLYYSAACFTYRVPLAAGFESGDYAAWQLQPVHAQPPAQANRSIVAPGYNGSAYAAFVQTTGTRDNLALAEMYKFFGPLCPGEARVFTFAYYQDPASTGVSSLVFVVYTADSQQLVAPQSVNFQFGGPDSLGNPAGQWNVVSYPFTVPAQAGETMYVSVAQVVQGSDAYLGLWLDDFQTPQV